MGGAPATPLRCRGSTERRNPLCGGGRTTLRKRTPTRFANSSEPRRGQGSPQQGGGAPRDGPDHHAGLPRVHSITGGRAYQTFMNSGRPRGGSALSAQARNAEGCECAPHQKAKPTTTRTPRSRGRGTSRTAWHTMSASVGATQNAVVCRHRCFRCARTGMSQLQTSDKVVHACKSVRDPLPER